MREKTIAESVNRMIRVRGDRSIRGPRKPKPTEGRAKLHDEDEEEEEAELSTMNFKMFLPPSLALSCSIAAVRR